ncbi:MAG TPA: PAS domain S-box protein [Anaeromyxobacter sp.]
MAETTTWTSPLLDLLFDEPSVGRCLVAPDGSVLRANAEWLRSTGFALDRVLGADIVALFPQTRDMALALHARARAGHHVAVPRHAQNVNGRETWWEGSIDPVPMDGGTGLLLTTREASSRLARDAAARSPRRTADVLAWIREIADHAPAAVFVKDPDGRYVFANRFVLDLLGLDAARALGASAAEVFPASVARRAEEYERRVAAGEEVVSEDVIPTPRGDRVLVAVRFPFRIRPGSVGTFGIAVDVTDRVRAESSLRESDERFRLLTDAMPQIVCVLAPDGAVEYVNTTWATFSGLDREATARAGWEAIVHPHDLAAARGCRRRALESRSPQAVELRYRAADGSYRWFLSRLAPVVEGGRVVRLVGAAMDIEDRVRAEEALRGREREARDRAAELQAVLDAVPAAVFIARDPGARTMEGNRYCTETLRIEPRQNGSRSAPDPERLRGFRVTKEGVEIPARDFPVRIAARTGREVRDHEFDLEFSDGEVRHMFGNATPLRTATGEPAGAVGAFLDVTDRTRTQSALRDSEERLRLALAAGRMGTYDIELATDLVVTSPATDRLFGFDGTDAPGPHATSRYFARIHPDDLETVNAALRASVEEGKEHVMEYRVVHPDGGVRWLHSRGVVARDASGRPARLHGAIVDVTARRVSEDALREADRRKDEFLGMLSHELRNPLAPIRNSIFILRHSEPGEQARRAMDVIERQTEHLTRLVDDLLDVTRIARGKIELRRDRLDLRELVRRASEDLRPPFEARGVALRLELPADPLWTSADPTRLAQVVGNLLNNAAKFTRAGDSVTLSLRRAPGAAELEVADTGAGIEPWLLPHVFEPFVQAERTLARTQGGLGLGLALVKGLVELHGGTVRAHSAGRGRGTAVTVSLPLVADGEARGAARPALARSGGVHVLVVDDSRDAADSLAQVVELLGHSAEVVYDGAAAVARVEASAPEVVLCDIGLPGMDGYEVARRVRAARGAGVRLVAVTGYAQPEDLARAVEAGFDAHLPKPPTPEQIAEVLERVRAGAALRGP